MIKTTLNFISDVLFMVCFASLMLLISCLDRPIPSVQFYICLYLTLGSGILGTILHKFSK